MRNDSLMLIGLNICMKEDTQELKSPLEQSEFFPTPVRSSRKGDFLIRGRSGKGTVEIEFTNCLFLHFRLPETSDSCCERNSKKWTSSFSFYS